MTALMVVAPLPVPELVIVPVLLMDVPESVIVPAPVVASTKLPVPALVLILPLKVRLLAPGARVKVLLSVTALLKMSVALLVIVSVPLLPALTVMGLVKVPERVPPLNVALALPLVFPIVIVPIPKALRLVLALTCPASMVTPPVKEVLAPERVNCEVLLF